MKVTVWFGACAIASSLIASSALSFGQANSPPDDARALMERGTRLRHAGHDDEALELFRRAYEIAHSAPARARMALAEMALGQWTVAEQHLIEALASPRDAWITNNRGTLETSLRTIQTHLGSLDVRGAPAGAAVLIGGEQVGTAPMAQPARVPIGRVTLVVRASGYGDVERVIDVREGALTRESVSMNPVVAEAPRVPERVALPSAVIRTETPGVQTAVAATTPESPPAASASVAPDRAGSFPYYPVALVTGVLGVGALGVGIWAAISAQSDVEMYNGAACTGAGAGTPLCVALTARNPQWNAAAAAGFIGGGVLVAAAVVFAIVGATRGPRSDAPHARLGCGPWFSTAGSSIICQGSF